MSNIVKNALCAFWLLDLNYVVLLKNARFTMLFYCFYTSKKIKAENVRPQGKHIPPLSLYIPLNIRLYKATFTRLLFYKNSLNHCVMRSIYSS